jgi:hypothetical protein
MSQSYIPGSCNLGKSEVRRRQIVALFGGFLTVSAMVGFAAKDVVGSARFSIFIPLMVFSVGFIQSRRKFCLAYGFMGTFNLGKLGDLSRVANPDDRRADRKTALVILIQSAALAIILSILVLLLPL